MVSGDRKENVSIGCQVTIWSDSAGCFLLVVLSFLCETKKEEIVPSSFIFVLSRSNVQNCVCDSE